MPLGRLLEAGPAVAPRPVRQVGLVVAPDIAYRRLKYVSDWRLVEENQRAALATIVHGISRLDAAGHWGDGTTSASDGQRFAMPHKVLQRTYSTRFNDFALEFYSFVADNYAPFYSRPIECTDRDAPFVLDGVLYHESDLDLEEHYTDTHGYTEINFAAFGMIGMRFCPPHPQPARPANLLRRPGPRPRRSSSRSSSADGGLVNFRLIAEQWDRIGQFYAALTHTRLFLPIPISINHHVDLRVHMLIARHGPKPPGLSRAPPLIVTGTCDPRCHGPVR